MVTFSAGSINLIKDLRSGYQETLHSEITAFLHSLKGDLENKPWWSNGWVFNEPPEGASFASYDTYISKLDWAVSDNNPKIWIGIQDFTLENLFVDCQEHPLLYIWVSNLKQYRSEAQKIGAQLVIKDKNNYGEINLKMTGGFLVQYPVQKYLTQQIQQFDEIMRPQIIGFMDYFAADL